MPPKSNPDATATAPTESNADRFKRVAGNRTAKALDAIGIIAGTSKKTNYEYTEEQAAKIVTALRSKVDEVERAFAGHVSVNTGFEL